MSEDLILLKWQYSSDHLWIQYNSYKNPKRLLYRNWQADSKIHRKIQRAQDSVTMLNVGKREEGRSWRARTSDSKLTGQQATARAPLLIRKRIHRYRGRGPETPAWEMTCSGFTGWSARLFWVNLIFQNYRVNEISKFFRYHKTPRHLIGLDLGPKFKDNIRTDRVWGGRLRQCWVWLVCQGLWREPEPSCRAFRGHRTKEMARKASVDSLGDSGLKRRGGTISLGYSRGKCIRMGLTETQNPGPRPTPTTCDVSAERLSNKQMKDELI